MTRSQFGTDQSFHVASSLTVASMGLWGWKAAADTALTWPLKVRRNWYLSMPGGSKVKDA